MAGANTYNTTSESPIVIWFDSNAYSTENQMTRELLQATVGNLMVFDDEDECKRFLGRDLNIKRLILIISGRLGKEFVPLIHHFTSILSIYVFCQDKKLNEEWSKQHPKVRAVVTTLDELVSEILSDPQIN